jgi:hypothetical protein
LHYCGGETSADDHDNVDNDHEEEHRSRARNDNHARDQLLAVEANQESGEGVALAAPFSFLRGLRGLYFRFGFGAFLTDDAGNGLELFRSAQIH